MSHPETDAHEARIASVLARKASQLGYEAPSVTTYTPLSALLASEDGADEDERQARSEIVGKMLDFILQDGAHPAKAMKNLYAIVHALRPQALPGKWTCQDIADLFGETKAAHSWRVKQLCGPKLKGARPIKARFQKAASATANYSAAQKGNHNRRHGLARPDERKAA
jgi:hypothetical protein